MPPLSPSLSPSSLGFLVLLIAPLLFFIAIAIFQWLWNITVPDIFKIRAIGFWEAFRLLLLAAILFGGSLVRFKAGG